MTDLEEMAIKALDEGRHRDAVSLIRLITMELVFAPVRVEGGKTTYYDREGNIISELSYQYEPRA